MVKEKKKNTEAAERQNFIKKTNRECPWQMDDDERSVDRRIQNTYSTYRIMGLAPPSFALGGNKFLQY